MEVYRIKFELIGQNILSKLKASELDILIKKFNSAIDKSKIFEFLFAKSSTRNIFEEGVYDWGYINNIELTRILIQLYILTIQNEDKSDKLDIYFKIKGEITKLYSDEAEQNFETIQNNLNSYNINKETKGGLDELLTEQMPNFSEFHNSENEPNENYSMSENCCNKRTEPNGEIKKVSENEDGKEKKLFENKIQNNIETNIATEKEGTTKVQEIKKEYEYKKYFSIVKENNVIRKKKMEEFFHDNIYLFSSDENGSIDIIAISQEIALNKTNLERYFNYFSGEHFLQSKYTISKNQNELYITFPVWTQNKTFSFYQIIVFIFEINIKLNYLVYTHLSGQYKSIYNNQIKNIYKENIIFCIYFNIFYNPKEQSKIIDENFLSESNITEQIKEVKHNNEKLEKEKQIKNEISNIHKDAFGENPKTVDIFGVDIKEKIKEELNKKLKDCKKDDNNKIGILLNSLFLTFNRLINGKRFPFSNIKRNILNYFQNFFIILSFQILDYFQITIVNLEKMHPYYNKIYNLTIKKIKKILDKEGLKFDHFNYGSYANGLNIEGSDIDLLLYFYDNKDNNKVPEKLFESLNTDKDISKCKKNYASHKLLISLFYKFKKDMIEDKYNYLKDFQKKPDYYEDRPSILREIRVDIMFTWDIKEFNEKKEMVKLIKEKINLYPQAKPILFLLKRLFHIHYLNEAYFGGISSYSLLNFCFHVIESEMIPFPKLLISGELAFLIFKRYSEFDYKKYVVTREGGEQLINTNSSIRIMDYFNKENIFSTGYTPNRAEYNNYPKDFICMKIKEVFAKGFDLIKKEFRILCEKSQKIELKNRNDISFVLGLFNPKEK